MKSKKRPNEILPTVVQQQGPTQLQGATRSSPRLKNRNKQNKPVIAMAQEILAKKWGIMEHSQALDELTLKQYIDIYKKPLSVEAMAAISKLTEVAKKKMSKLTGKQAKKPTKKESKKKKVDQAAHA